MKKLLTTALLALTAALTAGAQSRTEVYTFPSEVLGAEKSCTVYLPDGYDRSQESYPVLYLLHGASGCHTDWTQKGDLRRIADEAIAAGMARPMIVVMPDASGEGPKRTGKHMGYFDVPGWDYERFFFEEFMPAVENATASPPTRRTAPLRGCRWAAAARRSTPCTTPNCSARPVR